MEATENTAPRGPTLVTVTASAPVVVLYERIDDRERHENGKNALQAGEVGHFVVGPNQSLRVIEG